MNKFISVLLVSPLCLAAPQVSLAGFGDASPDEIAQIRSGTYLETFDDNPQYSFNYKVADNVEQTYMAMEENRDGEQVTGSYQYVDPFGSLIIVRYTAGAMGYSETREVRQGFVRINPKPQKQSSASTADSAAFSSISSSASSNAASSGSSSNSGSTFISRPQSSTTFTNSGSTFASRPQSSVTFTNSGSSTSSQGQSSISSSSQSTSSGSSLNSNDIVSTIVSQVQPLISQTVSEAVLGATDQSSTTFGGSSDGQTSFTSSSQSSSSNSAQSSDDEIVSSIVSQLQPLVPQTVSSALGSSQIEISGASSLSNLADQSSTSSSFQSESSSETSNDIVSSVVSQVQPLISQTVSSAILGSSRSSAASPTATINNVETIPAPLPVSAVDQAEVSNSVGSVSDIFGSGGNFNVRFNTPSFNIEY